MTQTHENEESIDLTLVATIVAQHDGAPSALIPMLQALQEHYRYLPQAALHRLSELTGITPAVIAGVATFYTQFRHRPVGRHLISVCHGTACHVKGAGLVHDALRRYLHLTDEEEDTDADGLFTLQKVACLGCCTLAPVMQIDGVTYGHLTPDTVPRAMHDFLELDRRGLLAAQPDVTRPAATGLPEVRVGVGSCCIAGGSMAVRDALEQAIRDSGVAVLVKPVGCVGMCHQTPLVEVVQAGRPNALYARVQPSDAPALIARHFRPRHVGKRLANLVSNALDHLLTDEGWEPVTRYALDTRDAPVCAFLGPQRHLATEHYGNLDPLDLDEYLAHDGFQALADCLTARTPQEVIDTIMRAGLRGRGGAGFPTGQKWALVRAATGTPKYLICNGDEGDPGAFMDRMLLESYPYRVLEGMAIAAFAIGAEEGILYIRAEYPLAVRRIRAAIERCTARGFLGEGIHGTTRRLHLRVQEGAGAFVCGEETALIASLEGKRGMPRLRPPYPAAAGLWGQPTLVNNVETYAGVPWIMRHGAEEYAALGTARSAGTKVFALTGKIARGGLIEVPMGISLRAVVEEIGGGIADGKHLKAVQVGGPSGGCVPAALADTPVDYESLTAVGAIMGSGGMVVIDETDCMVDLARYFLEFTQQQSCGRCTFCRIGTRRMLDILDGLCTGAGKAGDLERLETLCAQVRQGSLCGLGQTAPNPVLSTLRYFHDEYEAHLGGRCPAGKCKALIAYHITDACIGCTKCAQVCPVEAIPITPLSRHNIDQQKCTRCDTCRRVCPSDAIIVE